MVERWNTGMVASQRIFSILSFIENEFCHLPNIAVSSPSRKLHEPEAKTHHSTIPAFHYSMQAA